MAVAAARRPWALPCLAAAVAAVATTAAALLFPGAAGGLDVAVRFKEEVEKHHDFLLQLQL